jgi:predicted secreted protein
MPYQSNTFAVLHPALSPPGERGRVRGDFKFVLLVFMLSISFFLSLAVTEDQRTFAQSRWQIVGKEAVWNPGITTMNGIREKCGSLTEPQVSDCFVSSMESSGASPQALAFTRSTGNTAYLRDFREMGRVDVAYVNYAFRANENDGCFLVNGDPQVIDVDDIKYQPKDALQKNSRYTSLAKEFPNVSIWPGQRSGTGYPLLNKLPGSGQRFVFRYRLLNGCRTCERLGNAWFAFDFDRNGKFLGTRLMGIDRDTGPDKEIVEIGRVQDDYTDPNKPIEVATGQEFSIILGANRTVGYHWDIAKPVDQGVIKLVRSDYKNENGGKATAGGKEVWTFKAIGEGKTKVTMKYIRPREKNTSGVKTVTFDIVVKK